MRASKEAKKLPKKVKILLDTLTLEIEGPYRRDLGKLRTLEEGVRNSGWIIPLPS